MRELRDRGAERLIKQNLFVSVRQVVLTANHMRDAHLSVVENDRQVVMRMAVRSQQYQVFNFGMGTFLLAVNNVREVRSAFTRDFQSNRKWFTRSRPGVRFFQRQIAIRIAALIDSFGGLRASALGDALLDAFVVALLFRREVA